MEETGLMIWIVKIEEKEKRERRPQYLLMILT